MSANYLKISATKSVPLYVIGYINGVPHYHGLSSSEPAGFGGATPEIVGTGITLNSRSKTLNTNPVDGSVYYYNTFTLTAGVTYILNAIALLNPQSKYATISWYSLTAGRYIGDPTHPGVILLNTENTVIYTPDVNDEVEILVETNSNQPWQAPSTLLKLSAFITAIT